MTNERIYSERQTVFAVALGGPLGGAYSFWKTFNAVGKPKHARNIAVVMFALLIVTIAGMFIPFFDNIPNVVFWGAQIGLTYGIYRSQLWLPSLRRRGGIRCFGRMTGWFLR